MKKEGKAGTILRHHSQNTSFSPSESSRPKLTVAYRNCRSVGECITSQTDFVMPSQSMSWDRSKDSSSSSSSKRTKTRERIRTSARETYCLPLEHRRQVKETKGRTENTHQSKEAKSLPERVDISMNGSSCAHPSPLLLTVNRQSLHRKSTCTWSHTQGPQKDQTVTAHAHITHITQPPPQ